MCPVGALCAHTTSYRSTPGLARVCLISVFSLDPVLSPVYPWIECLQRRVSYQFVVFIGWFYTSNYRRDVISWMTLVARLCITVRSRFLFSLINTTTNSPRERRAAGCRGISPTCCFCFMLSFHMATSSPSSFTDLCGLHARPFRLC